VLCGGCGIAVLLTQLLKKGSDDYHIGRIQSFLDPFADKATQVAILVTLAIKGVIPFWILSIVVIKEFAMIARCVISLWKRTCSF